MTDEELDELTDLLRGVIDEPSLTPWEKNFVADIQAQVDKWGTQVRISPKQQAILDKLRDKCN